MVIDDSNKCYFGIKITFTKAITELCGGEGAAAEQVIDVAFTFFTKKFRSLKNNIF